MLPLVVAPPVNAMSPLAVTSERFIVISFAFLVTVKIPPKARVLGEPLDALMVILLVHFNSMVAVFIQPH